MINLLNIKIIENNKGGHEDLLFDVRGLICEKYFDTYYFSLAIEPKSGILEIKSAVAKLLGAWMKQVNGLRSGNIIYLPIDFSDQYTGCLKVENLEDRLLLTYGLSKREGWSVNPISPSEYFHSIIDFEAESITGKSISKIEFVNALNWQIKKLTE